MDFREKNIIFLLWDPFLVSSEESTNHRYDFSYLLLSNSIENLFILITKFWPFQKVLPPHSNQLFANAPGLLTIPSLSPMSRSVTDALRGHHHQFMKHNPYHKVGPFSEGLNSFFSGYFRFFYNSLLFIYYHLRHSRRQSSEVRRFSREGANISASCKHHAFDRCRWK